MSNGIRGPKRIRDAYQRIPGFISEFGTFINKFWFNQRIQAVYQRIPGYISESRLFINEFLVLSANSGRLSTNSDFINESGLFINEFLVLSAKNKRVIYIKDDPFTLHSIAVVKSRTHGRPFKGSKVRVVPSFARILHK